MKLSDFNSAPADTALRRMLECCGSRAWASGMAARRPFSDRIHLHVSAEEVWRALPEAGWLEAFAAHPRIGESAALEQIGMMTATRETAAAIRELNREYESRFGFIFITCASGKSAEQMYRELVERLRNDRPEELLIAVAAQRDITALRLRKLFG